MPQLIEEVIKSFDPEDKRPVKLWAQDEARFGRMNNPKKCWAPKKIRPIVFLQRIREFLYVFTASCPATGENYSFIFEACNTDAMQIFLENFSLKYADFKNIMIVDRASWHTTQKLPPIDNIRFIYLPTGSPELNPAEHIWEHIREKHLGNRIYNSLSEFEEDLISILEKISDDIQTIKSMINFHWLQFA